MSKNEERIRELAYQIWESEGRPQGQAARHWEMACVLVDAETEEPVKAPPRARRISKPKTMSLIDAAPENAQEIASEKPAPAKKSGATRAP
ncbi:DUF2934 domain-containing protein [Pseudomonas sp. BN102]|uniref:DUF2934 domain-containing protein n=1 Tax=Pseudomonas sp. BN102 TaxID=2567886 RepID=UPI002454DF83|nr:DUF2934 domain-containing protein [Pseudomonas sp. BN102]MDH4612496.1 DUF2934 domain-containing protein [Pseudomonas sp. BN102]